MSSDIQQNMSKPVIKMRDCIGKWIWCKEEAKPYHFFLFARGSFELTEKPAATRLHISASDRYLVYINGSYLGRGPARSDPLLKSYDAYDVAKHLKVGKNTIAIRAYYYGKPPEALDAATGPSWEGEVHLIISIREFPCLCKGQCKNQSERNQSRK